MAIPLKIDPCPIIEAIVEVRFETDFPAEAVFGLLYEKFKQKYPEPEKLPILQLPEIVRDQDPALKYHPHHRLRGSNYSIQIGPRVFSLSNVVDPTNPYVGWGSFSVEIKKALELIVNTNLIKSVERVGIRYINFFSEDIFDKLNLSLLLDKSPFKSEQALILAEVKADRYNIKIQAGQNAEVIHGGVRKKGTLVDIDVYTLAVKDVENLQQILEKEHEEEKKMFYTIIGEKVLETLNPRYAI